MEYQRYLLVPGTWAAGRALRSTTDPPDYWEPGGALVVYLQQQGWDNVSTGRMYWDGRLQGTPLTRLLMGTRFQGQWHIGWRVGGDQVAYMLWCLNQLYQIDKKMGGSRINPADVIGFCHSHGLGPMSYGLSQNICPHIKAIMSIASPTRADMEDVYLQASEKVDRWLHLQMGSRDRMKWLGTIGTGSWADTLGLLTGLTRGPEQATRRDRLVEYDHSQFVNLDPMTRVSELWPSRLAYLLEGAQNADAKP